ncbi:MAG: hypothetical protein A3E23_07775 [Burkholderiales bacterium RIFCSPHIGHO2_12_FULL_65_48]|nr:MAG: hypothetical protein A3C40_02715 [Burkholderiales bacterium RIFCSPHIGHO2_02_FULL_64_19]OGB25058.1 MAG: hypothetical protein A3E23_07775 [Burkholderiales bacterium RIFCSPHIGHO2_12_FULL_65_48]OGB53736.1 MAG: hypothetical protein A3F71_09945 [Burkholderiales bacterium RIFCSPLOWO2_12_FULL_64_33]
MRAIGVAVPFGDVIKISLGPEDVVGGRGQHADPFEHDRCDAQFTHTPLHRSRMSTESHASVLHLGVGEHLEELAQLNDQLASPQNARHSADPSIRNMV